MVEAAERGDFAGARQMHHFLVPLMLGNFIESNPGTVKFAMAAMGLVRRGVSAAGGLAAAGNAGKIRELLKALDVLKGGAVLA
jgi:dihydrodipicolinate synthase/N-acetylneuraminate lyase